MGKHSAFNVDSQASGDTEPLCSLLSLTAGAMQLPNGCTDSSVGCSTVTNPRKSLMQNDRGEQNDDASTTMRMVP